MSKIKFHFLYSTEKENLWGKTPAMDPSKLSMEQGKAFLQEIGIPQRDVSTRGFRSGK